ncbi:hypothetical protein [Nonomuraea sp. JJY05]|uniref:hypothetical protein n=1 Tax=Nonomuraea sp. JJY05 TaxID=3350255 RepID=UPI00373F109C
MLIREAMPDDWPRMWTFMESIVRAGETLSWDRSGRGVGRALGEHVLSAGFRHPVHGYVGLHIMYRQL